ncbi:PREDICTED: cyclin-dependent kinase inhibitor 3 [Nanorana parkeri]|uniref:cyclin-dependent kinase inhibitor 3 n=1 Tax=Nanorana parkeri TaxID=125878 RepID=UPI000854B61A|nr:PREDICTED: cyclin-dependent kinase inhibitor 3 [Nanorana parkeri]
MSPNEFDSSDEEHAESELTGFEVSWLSLEPAHYAAVMGIGPLPGCKFKNIRRNLFQNIEEMRAMGIQDVFVFCTLAELRKYRVPTLLQEYSKQDFVVHHHPFLDGDVPQCDALRRILDDLRACMDNNRKALIHCYGGLEALNTEKCTPQDPLSTDANIAACLLMRMSDSITPQEAIDLVQAVRGPGAIQTIKQYNFVNEFRENMSSPPRHSEESDRALSR